MNLYNFLKKHHNHCTLKGTLAGERWVGRFPIPTRGHTLCGTLYNVYTYFGLERRHRKVSMDTLPPIKNIKFYN